MKKLNLNQKKAIADVLINISTALISIIIVSQIFIEQKFDKYYLILGIVGFIISVLMIFISISILEK